LFNATYGFLPHVTRMPTNAKAFVDNAMFNYDTQRVLIT